MTCMLILTSMMPYIICTDVENENKCSMNSILLNWRKLNYLYRKVKFHWIKTKIMYDYLYM